MALTLTLYIFTKRQNSTAIPSSGGRAVDVVLKKETSFNNPSFILNGGRPSENYASFEGAYYFIDDIVSIRDDVWELVCSIDPLGTLRSAILSTSAFVEYAAQGNGQIVDSRLGVEYGVAGIDFSTASVFPGSLILSSGSKYITVVGQTTTETYYVSDTALKGLFQSIAQWADNTIDTTSLETIITTGLKQLIGSGNAAECVRDAYILPCGPITSILDGAETIYLGMFNTGITGYKISGSGDVEKTTSIDIPHHYGAGDWRRQAPYEICQLFLPLYGTINIPSDIAADSSSLTIECRLNARSGDFTYYISGSGRSGKEIVVGGNCSAPLAIGASNINMSQAVHAGLNMGSNAMFGNIPGMAASLLSMSPVPSTTGQAGGVSNKYPNAQCMIYWRNTSDVPGANAGVQGLPLQATRQISTLSGYVQTRGFSVGGTARNWIKQRVNELMDSGVFVE